VKTIVVYGVPGSPYTRSALLGLEEKHASYRLATLALNSTRNEQHRQLHAFGRIPVMEDEDFRLYETQAILRYLDSALPGPSLQPREPRALARMNQIMGIVDWYVFPQISVRICAERFFSQRFWGRPTDESTVAKALPDANNCVRELGRLKGSAPFMAGDEVSIADLMLAPHMEYFRKTPEGASLLSESPIGEWLERMAARPSMQATQAERLMAA